MASITDDLAKEHMPGESRTAQTGMAVPALGATAPEQRPHCLMEGLAAAKARCFEGAGKGRLDSNHGLDMQPCVAACVGFRLTGVR